MNTSSPAYRFFRLIFVSCGVYCFFRYCFFWILPFLAAYFLMYRLYPFMQFLHERLRWPGIFSHYGTLAAFFGGLGGILGYIIWKLCRQCGLLLQNFPVYRQILQQSCYRQTMRMCHCIDYYLCLESGTVYTFLEERFCRLDENGIRQLAGDAGRLVVRWLSGSFEIFAGAAIFAISAVILIRELPALQAGYRRSSLYTPLHSIFVRLKEGGLTYLKVELLILLLNWAVCSLGLLLTRNPYCFLLGMAIAVFDAFPVLGSGLIFVPWGICRFLEKEYYIAAVLVTTYLITMFIREYLEAKLLGKGMGLNPFFMLAAIFVGVKLFGVTGIFFGPLAVVLIRAILTAEWGREEKNVTL